MSSTNVTGQVEHHDHNHNFAEANRDFFNKEAITYDDRPLAVETARKCAQALLKAFDFDEKNTCVLDYACGTGLISRELAPFSKQIIGVDISQGMVDQYNLRVANQGISSEEMRAVAVELEGKEGELDNQKFDVIVCAQAYHHFTSIESVTKTLAYFLKPGGALLVTDLIKSEDSTAIFHEHKHVDHVVPHKGGFYEDEIRDAFVAAKLENISFGAIANARKGERVVQFFLAKGLKTVDADKDAVSNLH